MKAEEIYNIFKNPKPIPVLPDNHSYYKETHCFYCKKEFIIGDPNHKVLDHDHVSGEYRAAAHRDCNLNVQLKKLLIVFLHNATGYDNHFLIREMAKRPLWNDKDNKLKAISKSDEKYLSISAHLEYGPSWKDTVEIRILDSYSFMAASLSQLVNNSEGNLNYMKKEFPNETEFNLLTRKGVYPYEWQNSFEKLRRN